MILRFSLYRTGNKIFSSKGIFFKNIISGKKIFWNFLEKFFELITDNLLSIHFNCCKHRCKRKSTCKNSKDSRNIFVKFLVNILFNGKSFSLCAVVVLTLITFKTFKPAEPSLASASMVLAR